MLRRSYDWVMRLAASRHAVSWLAVLAFAEGVFFPIPPDVILMPLVLARREMAWRYAAVTVVASVLGGSTGYAVGFFLRPVGLWLLALTGHAGNEVEFQSWYAQWGVFLLALPIPYKLMAIASGLFKMDFPLFLTASLLIRGLRFFAVAGLVRAYGEPIREFVERRLALVVSAVALLIVALVAALKFIG
ncbi:MAG TPA: YqaA family protein [Caulobacteraceae bacterium]|jgi:membrane protein YqaA with SNARE-associated domain|nr:YqaA family protein [Caulobacteraceae bacterium]